MKSLLKKSTFIVVVIAAVVLGITSCHRNPVQDYPHLTDSFWDGGYAEAVEAGNTERAQSLKNTVFPLNSWYNLTSEGRMTEADSLLNVWKAQLTRNVIHYYGGQVDSVTFSRVKGKAYGVESGSGKTHDGKVGWEILVKIFENGTPTPRFLVCGNGLTSSEFDEVSMGHSLQTRFVVPAGGSVAGLIPDSWESVVEDLKIPCTNESGEIVKVSLNELRKGVVKSQWLFEGDVIDLGMGTVYNKAGQIADFDRRIQETQKANKALMQKKSSKNVKKSKIRR